MIQAGSTNGSGSADSKRQADSSNVGQLEKAKAWVLDYPDLQGLTQREAARRAGVGLATLQRALKARGNVQGSLR